MDWSTIFWEHFKHLRVVDVDVDGNELRVLVPRSCIGCRRVWEMCTPLGGGLVVHPRIPFFIYARGDELIQSEEQRATEALSLQRVRSFTVRHL